MFDFHRSDRGSNPGPIVAVKFHNVYDYTIERLGKCLKTISHGFTQAMRRKLGSQLGT